MVRQCQAIEANPFLEETSDIVMIGFEPENLYSKWPYFIKSFSELHPTWAEVQSHCFSTLIVRSSQLFNFHDKACALVPI